MKKLFLASYFNVTANLFAEFEKDLSGKTVTFIPTASKVEKFILCESSGKKAIRELGLTVDELDVSVATYEEISEKLHKNDFIYVGGGNTFFLLQELKRTGADKIIIDEVNSGKVYIGESAGAIITSPNIEYAKLMDPIKKAPLLSDFAALNFVDFYTIPHYTNQPFKKSAQNIIDAYSSSLNLLPITNKHAILVNGDDIKIKNV